MAVKKLSAPSAAPFVSVGRKLPVCSIIRPTETKGAAEGANDRTYWELSAEEWAWLRHDQVGLKVLAAKRRRIQVWKGHGYTGHGIHGSQGRRIARLVVPGLKMSCLRRADAEHDSQHFHVGHPLGQRGIETVATLFDSRKVECCGVGDRLKEVRVVQIGVGSGNCRMLPNR